MKHRLLCLFGSHHPNKAEAKLEGGVFQAPCRHCGVALMKVKADWVLADPKAG